VLPRCDSSSSVLPCWQAAPDAITTPDRAEERPTRQAETGKSAAAEFARRDMIRRRADALGAPSSAIARPPALSHNAVGVDIEEDAMILVTGANGNVGKELVSQLAAAKQPVRALVRDPGRRAQPAGVELVAGDLDRPASLGPALGGVRGVFLLGGHKDMPGLLTRIREAGVQRVVLLSSRSVVGGSPTNAIVRMWMTSEEAVRSSGIPWTLVRPSGFASNALRWLPQLRAGDLVRAPFANAAIASIDPYDIAAVARVALTTSGHESKSYALSGPEAQLPAQQVAILAQVLGRPLRFQPQPDDEARAELLRSTPPDVVEAFFRFFVGGEFDDAVILPTVQQVTGQAPRSFEQWARAHRAELGGTTGGQP